MRDMIIVALTAERLAAAFDTAGISVGQAIEHYSEHRFSPLVIRINDFLLNSVLG
jgi:hypothetical protein